MTEPAALPRLRRGTRLGKYQLDRTLGSGAFSQVWKARDTIERRWVAVKIPNPAAPGSREEDELLEEIRLGARLEHPNILHIRNADYVQGRYILVTDLANESLDERLQRRLATDKALSYISQVLAGLAFAHENRVIHRDLKPSNLLLFAGDQVRIADLGLAREVKHTMFSATGSGSLPYLAPEQAHGRPCLASDTFSLGLICMEILTGELPRWPFDWPFAGLKVLQRKVPPEIVRIIRRACHMDYRKRYHDGTEMLAAFGRAKGALARFKEPKRRPRRRSTKVVWRDLRFRECERAYRSRLLLRFHCPNCQGPISEHMAACPWCGGADFAFVDETEFPHYCRRCKRGLLDEWRYCPWCWGSAFKGADGKVRANRRYDASCRQCKNPMISGMRYCPWCHSKRTRPVKIEALPHKCRSCRGSVTREFWEHCPWCQSPLARRRGKR